MNQYNPNTVSPPYETILELKQFYVEDANKSSQLNSIHIDDNTIITPELAQKLEIIFLIPVSFWLNRQRNYDQWKQHDPT